jgi:hypothetical protein
MLFVYDDHAKIGHRCEHGGARPHRHSALPAPEHPPCVRAFALGQRTMQHGDRVAERSAEPAHRLGSQTDLRNEHDRSLSCRKHSADGLEINQCLSASGHAEQERAFSAGKAR